MWVAAVVQRQDGLSVPVSVHAEKAEAEAVVDASYYGGLVWKVQVK